MLFFLFSSAQGSCPSPTAAHIHPGAEAAPVQDSKLVSLWGQLVGWHSEPRSGVADVTAAWPRAIWAVRQQACPYLAISSPLLQPKQG